VVVRDIARAATRRWLAGTYSAADAEAVIEIGCQLLELPDAVVDAELGRVAPDVAITPGALPGGEQRGQPVELLVRPAEQGML
jgi:hypothetical protein